MRYNEFYTNLSLDHTVHMLGEDEIENPYQVLKEFFLYNTLPELREKMEIFAGSKLKSNLPKRLKRKNQNELILLSNRLQKLVEAAHVINERRKLGEMHAFDQN